MMELHVSHIFHYTIDNTVQVVFAQGDLKSWKTRKSELMPKKRGGGDNIYHVIHKLWESDVSVTWCSCNNQTANQHPRQFKDESV